MYSRDTNTSTWPDVLNECISSSVKAITPSVMSRPSRLPYTVHDQQLLKTFLCMHFAFATSMDVIEHLTSSFYDSRSDKAMRSRVLNVIEVWIELYPEDFVLGSGSSTSLSNSDLSSKERDPDLCLSTDVRELRSALLMLLNAASSSDEDIRCVSECITELARKTIDKENKIPRSTFIESSMAMDSLEKLDPSNIPNISEKGLWLACYPVKEVARQLLYWEANFFVNVPRVELINQRWKRHGHVVLDCIKNYNLLRRWALSLILTGKGPEERATAVEFLVDVAQESFDFGNLSSMAALTKALSSLISPSQFSVTWCMVSSAHKERLNSLSDVMSPANDYGNHAAEMHLREGRWCIPYLGAFVVYVKSLEDSALSFQQSTDLQKVPLSFEKEKKACEFLSLFRQFQLVKLNVRPLASVQLELVANLSSVSSDSSLSSLASVVNEQERGQAAIAADDAYSFSSDGGYRVEGKGFDKEVQRVPSLRSMSSLTLSHDQDYAEGPAGRNEMTASVINILLRDAAIRDVVKGIASEELEAIVNERDSIEKAQKSLADRIAKLEAAVFKNAENESCTNTSSDLSIVQSIAETLCGELVEWSGPVPAKEQVALGGLTSAKLNIVKNCKYEGISKDLPQVIFTKAYFSKAHLASCLRMARLYQVHIGGANSVDGTVNGVILVCSDISLEATAVLVRLSHVNVMRTPKK